jgi:hypothetical protein
MITRKPQGELPKQARRSRRDVPRLMIWLRKYTLNGQEAYNQTVSHGLATPL